jgi:hypothetical protein
VARRLGLSWDAAAGIMGRAVARGLARRERPKVALSVPLEGWLRGLLCPWAQDLLAEVALHRDGILAIEPVRRAWTAFLGGRGESALGAWSILMFQAWMGCWGRSLA